MTNSRDLIAQLKEVKASKKLSLDAIAEMVERNGSYVSKATLSRLFSKGSEEVGFRYEDTIKPVALALLNIETIEEDDVADTKAMKLIIQHKTQRIAELESEILKEKDKYHRKLEAEREQSRRSIDFLKGQIDLKDKRMDMLLDMVANRDDHTKQIIEILQGLKSI